MLIRLLIYPRVFIAVVNCVIYTLRDKEFLKHFEHYFH